MILVRIYASEGESLGELLARTQSELQALSGASPVRRVTTCCGSEILETPAKPSWYRGKVTQLPVRLLRACIADGAVEVSG